MRSRVLLLLDYRRADCSLNYSCTFSSSLLFSSCYHSLVNSFKLKILGLIVSRRLVIDFSQVDGNATPHFFHDVCRYIFTWVTEMNAWQFELSWRFSRTLNKSWKIAHLRIERNSIKCEYFSFTFKHISLYLFQWAHSFLLSFETSNLRLILSAPSCD